MNTIAYSSGAAAKVIGVTPSNDFFFSIIERPASAGGSTANTTSFDSNVVHTTPASVDNSFQIIVNPSSLSPGYSLVNMTPAIVSVAVDGTVNRLTSGAAAVSIVTALGTKGYSRTMAVSTTAFDTFTSWITGSLAANIQGAIDGYISGKNPSATTKNVNAAGVRNPNIFTGALDLSAIPWGGVDMCLISQWHVIGSHVSSTGAIQFMRNDGVIESRNVTAILPFSTNGAAGDMNFVGVLDAAITTITPMQFLPATFTTKIHNAANNIYPLQVLRQKQATGTLMIEVIEAYLSTINAYSSTTLRKSTSTPYSSWSSPIESGDSNGAVFAPINGVATILTSMNNVTGGRLYTNHLTEIQTLMTTLRAGSTLTQANIAAFPTY